MQKRVAPVLLIGRDGLPRKRRRLRRGGRKVLRSSSFNLMRVTLMEMMAVIVVTATMIVSGRIVGCSS